MALPVDFNRTTVVGRYVDLDGNPVGGSVSFRAANILFDSAFKVFIIPKSITATLDSNGQFSVSLPASNDPDISPGFLYTVTEVFSGGLSGRTYTVLVPFDISPVDISDLAPNGPINPGTAYLTRGLADQLYAPIGGGGGGGGGPESDPFSVHITGNQTIDGVKTFLLGPLLPTPTVSGNPATKGYVDNALALKQDASGAVQLVGTQTVTGVKTFSASPVVPDPTTAQQAASKNYVDSQISGGGTVSDATTSVKGKIKLNGDLSGTADLPTVPGLASKATDSLVVHLVGSEVISGIKTFAVSPSIPTPTNGNHPVTKDYTDINFAPVAFSDEVSDARRGYVSLLESINHSPRAGTVVIPDDGTPITRQDLETVTWVSQSSQDPGAQARTGETWIRITLSDPGTGGTSQLWNNWDPTSNTSPPDLTAFPLWDSTGVPPGTVLTSAGTSYTTSANNQVVDALFVNGDLTVNHTGCIIKRCLVRGRILKGAGLGNSRTTKMWANEIGMPAGASSARVGIAIFPLEMKRCNIYGYTDGIHPTQSSTTEMGTFITWSDNFIHDGNITYDGGQSPTNPVGNPNSHTDLIQLDYSGNTGGSPPNPTGLFGDVTIRHNTFYAWSFNSAPLNSDGSTHTPLQAMSNNLGYYRGPNWFNNTGANADFNTGGASVNNGRMTSAIILNSGGTGRNITITNNLILGKPGHYIESSSVSGDYSNIVVSNNRFGSTACNAAGTVGNTTLASWTWTGNVRDDTGAAVP